MRKIILLLVLVSCSPAIKNLPPAEQAAITTRVYQAPVAQVWDAVLTVLENREYSLQSTDKDLGTFTTDFVYVSNIIAEYRKRIGGRLTAITPDQTKLKLILILELKTHLNTWKRIDLTRNVQDEYAKIFDLIHASLDSQTRQY